MPRPRTFDEADVLARARDAFWVNGYTATSISDLERATGLGRTSLYQAFGDKRALFDRVLTAYQDDGQASLERIVAKASDLREAAAGLFALSIDAARADRLRGEAARGCLIANATCELAAVDVAVGRFVAGNRERFSDRLLPLAEGTPALRLPPRAAVDLVFAIYSGLNLLAKSGASVAELDAAAAGGVAGL